MKYKLKDRIKEYFKETFKERTSFLVIGFFVMFIILFQRLFVLQIVRGEDFIEDFTYKITREIEVPGTRGRILDRNGVVLADNKVTYSVTIENSSDIQDNVERNELIHQVIQVVEKNGGKLYNDFKIVRKGTSEFDFATDSESEIMRFKKDVFSVKSSESLSDEQADMDAKAVFEFLRHGREGSSNKMFDIADSYNEREALKIMAVRYSLWMKRYERYQPITVASNISFRTVALIEENSMNMPGVAIAQESNRVYIKSKYLSHILGYTGVISPEELEKENKNLKNSETVDTVEYSNNDVIGKDGMEKTMETQLRGTSGKKNVLVNNVGKILEERSSTEPSAGDDVYLTIDSKLQESTYKELERKVVNVLIAKITSSRQSTINDREATTIGANELMFAFINNNIVDINRLSEQNATSLEKSVYKIFRTKQRSTLSYISNNLSSLTTRQKDLSEENQEYILYVYNMLKKSGILNANIVDTSNAVYKKWQQENVSFREFLLEGVSETWIDLDKLDIASKYYSSKEIFDEIIKRISEELKNDTEFSKLMYKNLIANGQIADKSICLLLYDQKVLKKDDDKERLQNGSIGPISFVKAKLDALKITPAMLALDPCAASCVVTSARTGEVLAMVSYPGYDNNKLSNGVDSDYYAKLLSDRSLPLFNHATMQKTAPGSTYKMLTASAGLEEGVIAGGTAIYDNFVFDKIAEKPKCLSHHGNISVVNAIEKSCNYFFYEVGWRLGQKGNSDFVDADGLSILKKYANQYGLTQKSGVEISEYEPNVSNLSAVHSSIGQGSNSYTPSQMSRYVTTIANKGQNFKLSLIDKVTTTDGKLLTDYKPKLEHQLDFQDSTWNLLHSGMRNVITNGTGATAFSGFDIPVAGKTGTAQESKKRSPHSLFVGFAPYNNPEVTITVALPFANSSATDVARKILNHHFHDNDNNRNNDDND